jgi:hypothetical protein
MRDESKAFRRNTKIALEVRANWLADSNSQRPRAGPQPPAEVGTEEAVPRRDVRYRESFPETIRHDLPDPRVGVDDIHGTLVESLDKLA